MTDTEYQTGDPVIDLAQGRPMLVIDAPDVTVAEWSERNGYELLDNYANGKFDPDAEEAVVECVYLGDVRSEPSKTYTFPVSRVALIDAHHADDGRRIADRVAVQTLERLLRAIVEANVRVAVAHAAEEWFDADLVAEAQELADVTRTVTADE